jgi:MFS family permease
MTAGPRRGTAIASYTFAAVMLGTTIPTPLYAIYASRLHLKPFLITVIFATYALGVIAALMLFGRLSDQVGRRPVLFAAVAFSVASAAVFVSSGTLPALFTGRVLSGISAGLVTGAATAYISELHHDRSRGSLLATASNMGGLGLGPLVSGLLAQHAPQPTRLPFIVGAGLLLPAILLLTVPDTVERASGGLAMVRSAIKPQRLGVPRGIRVPFASAAIAGFVGFAMLGFITALVGNFLSQGLGDRSHQTAGVVAFLVFAAGTAAQLSASELNSRTGSLIGLAVLPIGLTLVTLALPAKSLTLFLIGAMVGGVGSGFAIRSAVLLVNQIAPPARRGEVLSTFFVIGYVGITVPVVGAGILITTTTLLIATVTLAVFVAVLASVAAAILVRLPTTS